MRLKKEQLLKQGTFLIVSILIVVAFSSDFVLTRIEGVIMIAAYFAYVIYIWIGQPTRNPDPTKKGHIFKNVLLALMGLTLVLITSNLVVKNGVGLAESLGVSQSLIGIFLIGIGTGLPELSVALVSFKHKAMKMGVGNLIGSNICDLLFSLGVGVVISGFVVEKVNVFLDLPVLLFFSLVVLGMFYWRKKIGKMEGLVLISLFLVYAFVKFFITG